MNEVNITVQVHCTQPTWVGSEKNQYRLYINDDLLTERSWIWDTNTVINENIWVDLASGSTNIIKLIPILNPVRSMAKFGLKNLMVNDNEVTDHGGEQSELYFTV